MGSLHQSTAADNTQPVELLLGIDRPSGGCPRGRTGQYERAADRGCDRVRMVALRHPCDCWRCVNCGPRMLHEAGLHFAGKLEQAAGRLFEVRYKDGEYGRVRDRIGRKRRCEGYVSVAAFDDGGAFLVSLKAGAEPDADWQPLGRDEAVARLGELLRRMHYLIRQGRMSKPAGRTRPVNNSRTWKRAEAIKKGHYTLIGWLKGVKTVNDLKDLIGKEYSGHPSPPEVNELNASRYGGAIGWAAAWEDDNRVTIWVDPADLDLTVEPGETELSLLSDPSHRRLNSDWEPPTAGAAVGNHCGHRRPAVGLELGR